MSDLTVDDRVVPILEIARKKTCVSLNELAEELGVSTRTIRNYIKKLNSSLVGVANLENEKGKGYRLHIENEPLFNDLIEEINLNKELLDTPERRIAIIIDRLINNEKTYTLDELAFEMNIGRTTLVNELKKASVSLESYNLNISGKQNIGMHLSGRELDIRFFLIDNAYELLYGSYPLDRDIEDEIIRIVNKYDFETSTKTRLMQIVVVMLDRFLKNHPLTEIDEKHKKLLNSEDYQIALEIVAGIESRLPIKIPMAEILFLTIPIAGRRTPTNNRTMTQVKITEDVQKLLESIVERIGFNQEIIKENKTFFTDLQYHLTFMLNRLLFGLRLKNPMLTDVKGKYPTAFKMAKIAGQVIEEKYDLEVSEDELGYIAFYFGVFISQSEEKMKRLRKAAVICGTGRGTAKLVANQLERVLNDRTELDLFSENEITNEILLNYDIVFSTIKLPFDSDTPLIMISEIFDEQSISRQIEEVTYLNNFQFKSKDSNLSILNHLINKEKYFVLDNTKCYTENVDEMINDLIAMKYLDAHFLERLKERAAKGSMVFDRYIALPHTINYQSNQIELALGVFPKKIVADGKEIKLVFLLGLPEQQNDNNDQLLVKIYDEIIQIANDQEIVDQLASTSSHQEIMQKLKKLTTFS